MDIADDILGGFAHGPQVRLQDQTVAEHRLDEELDVIGDHIGAALENGPGAAQFEQGQGSARAGAYCDLVVLACFCHQADNVALDICFDVDFFNGAAHGQKASRIGNGLQAESVAFTLSPPAQDFMFVFCVWVADGELHDKTVKLRLWQGECALVLNRVLCGNHDKGVWQMLSLALDGHLVFLHRFQ